MLFSEKYFGLCFLGFGITMQVKQHSMKLWEWTLDVLNVLSVGYNTTPQMEEVIITEDTIRQALRLDDADGIDCLPNEEIFVELAWMGYENPMVRNMDSPSKFLMYLRFLQVMINAQVDDLSSYNTKYTSPALTQKVFANIRRIGGIVELDANEDVTLVDVDTTVRMDADTQGRMEEDVTAIKDINAVESEPIVFDDEEVTMSMAQTL
nr:hypothetical protein [Tanacetum cinerariifolium]